MKIGVLGATGPAGKGLAARLADVGYDVLAGSRERAKAEAVVDELQEQWGDRVARHHPGEQPAGVRRRGRGARGARRRRARDREVLRRRRSAGKIVVSMANNLVRNGTEFNAVLPPHGSLAKEMQALLWRSQIVTAFHLVPAAEFVEPRPQDGERRRRAAATTTRPARRSWRSSRASPTCAPFDGGSLENAVGMETFAAVLLTINIRHKVRAGLRLSGI